ncbi:TPA: transcriptional regulator [Escherichia coli]|uniref:PapB/FocB family fimbrial expression transcriptional regulator n=1 Tax=Escherichia coli TaxID=562 RepID=UPI00164EFCD8|nr:transcriptional regulator [Escherichia coli]MCC4691302.1 adhesin biosynthesis transcription regulatory family protein [Escherichia coli]MCX1297767.1 transcriptional regulator [Escherichia coli]MCX2053377.1 transcriptional regulator [Escherichia coli]HAO1375120.1 transcriptional regulator [Escherichia coli]
MSENHFEILLSLTPINSQKVRFVLKYYFLDGCSKKNTSDRNNVYQGDFSVILRKIINNVDKPVGCLYS